jgi:hypothetical protein
MVPNSKNASPTDDPGHDDPQWKDITSQCHLVVNELLAEGETLFGPRTKILPVRVTEFSEGPRVDFSGGVAYIRIGPGVSSDEKQLRHQIALEVVHVLSVAEAPMTALEEGLTAWFAVHVGGFPPQPDEYQAPYKAAYEGVSRLLKKYPTAIKQLRTPPRSIVSITADELCNACPEMPDLAQRLAQAF